MRSRKRLLLALLTASFLLVPLAAVSVVPSDTVEPYVFKGRITESLGHSANGQLHYYGADVIEGEAPAASIVVALDGSYTRGLDRIDVEPGLEAWFQGGLMTADIFYGEQYLFFGLPQVYVRQVKSVLLWPDQWTELRVLYASPLETLAAPVEVAILARSDGVTMLIMGVLLARCALVAAAMVAIIRRRPRSGALATVLLGYAVIAVLLTIPIIGDLY